MRAARDGTVTEAGRDEVLGSYLVISHPGGWQTVYGHLSSVRAILNSKVEAGSEVGRVGSTGRATGSHLHFEVRRKGGATDPYPLLAAARAVDGEAVASALVLFDRVRAMTWRLLHP